jgi:hypothetical protein
MRAASAALPGLTTASLQPVFSRVRSRLSRTLSVWLLRVRLGFQPGEWLARLPVAAEAAFDRTGRAIDHLSWQAAKGATSAAIRAIRWRKVALVASAPFVLPAEWRAAMVRLLAYLAAIYALSLVATELFRQQQQAAAVFEPAPRPAWTEVENPWAAFELAAPGYDEDDSDYAIRRHAQGGRKDILTFGELGTTQRFMNFEIYRAGDEIARFATPAEEIHALGSDQGRVLGLRSGMPIPSKFGPFHTFEFAIGPFGGYNCIGFLRATENPRVQISGLSCGMNLLVDRRAISCALDRLTLISAGSDPDIAKLFAYAEQKRHFCGQRDPLLYKTPKRPGDTTSAISSRLKLRGRQR